jgi:hypothetical protein
MLQTPLFGVTHVPVFRVSFLRRRIHIGDLWARWTPSALETIRRKIIMPQPNDKCPCGSGKLYKDCCGKPK